MRAAGLDPIEALRAEKPLSPTLTSRRSSGPLAGLLLAPPRCLRLGTGALTQFTQRVQQLRTLGCAFPGMGKNMAGVLLPVQPEFTGHLARLRGRGQPDRRVRALLGTAQQPVCNPVKGLQ